MFILINLAQNNRFTCLLLIQGNMSELCDNCFDAGLVPSCVGELIICEIDSPPEDVDVYFQTPYGSIIKYEASIGEGGEISIESVKLPTGTTLQMWLNNPQGNNFNRAIPCIIGGKAYNCINIKPVWLNEPAPLIHDLRIEE